MKHYFEIVFWGAINLIIQPIKTFKLFKKWIKEGKW